jgi:hypothetical protein
MAFFKKAAFSVQLAKKLDFSASSSAGRNKVQDPAKLRRLIAYLIDKKAMAI